MQKVWENELFSRNWKDSLMVVLYKGKGSKDLRGNSWGISLLSVVVKALCSRWGIAWVTMWFSQWSSHSRYEAAPGEVCSAKNESLVFVKLTKAFYTVNRAALWKILENLGCPANFLNVCGHLAHTHTCVCVLIWKIALKSKLLVFQWFEHVLKQVLFVDIVFFYSFLSGLCLELVWIRC